MVVTMIKLTCKKCEKHKLTERERDPPSAVEVRIMCPDCNAGDFDAPIYFGVDGTEVGWVTVDELLAAHAQFGRMNFAMTKAAMGPNWPVEWDNLGPGQGIFEDES